MGTDLDVLLLEVFTHLLVCLLHSLHLGLQHPRLFIMGPGIIGEAGSGEQGALKLN